MNLIELVRISKAVLFLCLIISPLVAADDSAALTKAIAETPAGGELRLEPRVYRIGESVPLKGITVDARGTTVRKLPGVPGPLFIDNHAAADGLRVIGGVFDGSRKDFSKGSPGSAFHLCRTRNVTFDGLDCRNFPDDALKLYKVQRVVMVDVDCTNCGNCGIELSAPAVDGFAGTREDQGCSDVIVMRANCSDIQNGLGGGGNACGIYVTSSHPLYSAERIRIVDSSFRNCYRAVQFETAIDSPVIEDVLARDCTIDDCSGVGVALIGVRNGLVDNFRIRQMGNAHTGPESDVSGVIISRIVQGKEARDITVRDTVIVDDRQQPNMEFGVLVSAGLNVRIETTRIEGATVSAVSGPAWTMTDSTIDARGRSAAITANSGAIDLIRCDIRNAKDYCLNADGPVTVRLTGCNLSDAFTVARFRGEARGEFLQTALTGFVGHGLLIEGTQTAGPRISFVESTVSDPRPGKGPRYPLHATNPFGIRNIEQLVIARSRFIGAGEAWSRTSPTSRGTADQVSLNFCRYFTIVENQSIDGGENGFTLTNCSDGVVARNLSAGHTGNGIQVSSRGAPSSRIPITDNVVVDCGQRQDGRRDTMVGIYVQEGEWIPINGNLVRGGGIKFGIQVAESARTVEVGANSVSSERRDFVPFARF